MAYETPILVVDDSSSMRSVVRQILKEAGYKNVLLAQDGVEGLKLLKGNPTNCTKKVGLILCDWTMPNMSGIEMLQAVRNTNETKTIPFIMVTNEKRSDRILEAVKKGASDFIVKPFPASLLVEKVNKFLPPSP